jgi:PAS domain S-box-containing protein
MLLPCDAIICPREALNPLDLHVDDTSEHTELYSAIAEATSDAVIFAGRDGLIRLWNRGAELLFGYPAADVVGQSLDVIIPERLRSAHWQGFDRSIETGRTKYADRVMTTRSMHKDGRRLYVDLSFGLVKNAGGEAIGAFAIGRDATARYAAEAEQRARIAQLEAQVADATRSRGAAADSTR